MFIAFLKSTLNAIAEAQQHIEITQSKYKIRINKYTQGIKIHGFVDLETTAEFVIF